jgi:cytochrome c biogenesis protein CcmG/thiol:disulfide interchange protein DsbE
VNQPKPLPRLLLFLPLLLSAVLALLYWRGLTFDANRSPNRLLGKPLPSLSLPSLDDGSRILQTVDIKGPALINVWASWCGACRNEHQQLLEISRQYGVAIYGVDYQDEAATAKAWLRQQGNPFVWVMFDGAMAAGLPLDVFSLPQTYAIDANGIIRARHIGEVNETVWQSLREAMLAGPS